MNAIKKLTLASSMLVLLSACGADLDFPSSEEANNPPASDNSSQNGSLDDNDNSLPEEGGSITPGQEGQEQDGQGQNNDTRPSVPDEDKDTPEEEESTTNPSGEDEASESNNDTNDETPAVSASISEKYFDGDDYHRYLENNALGFYDRNRSGQARAIRNDLDGGLSGMVQFVQSHSVNPSGNEANNHPDVVAQREALLLFTPLSEGQYEVSAYQQGEYIGSLDLLHPNTLPKSDYANSDGRPDVIYSKRAYHAVLPWDWMKPGLSLVFDDGTNQGTLSAASIEFAAPAELVLHNIRLGMLTEPPRSQNHKLITDPILYTSDYFQTLPISKIVNAQYQEMQLDKVIIASGKIYNQISDDNGSVYAGDMRQNVAKEQISTGINEANWGRSSTANWERNPQLTARVTMHHAQGYYQNGVQAHGLSGGAGIGTLYSSQGNELSHELGHNYGLGHYPGRQGNNVFWAAHHADSGWGYIAHRNRMRANLHWTAAGTGINVVDNIVSSEVFANTYSYNKDAMSGGSVVSAFSAYTHHTGYSANKIQHWFAPKWIADPERPTGYKRWLNSEFVDANTQGEYRVPKKVGVPVITLLGGYDPSPFQQKAILYPTFVSNYGNTFALDENVSSSDCAMEIEFADGGVDQVRLHGSRINPSVINKFHINIEADRHAEYATLYCHQNGQRNVLAELDIPGQLPFLNEAVVVGEEAGYQQLQALELAQLEDALLQFDSGDRVVLDHALQSVVEAWPNSNILSGSAQLMLDDYQAQQEKARMLEAWVLKTGGTDRQVLSSLMADLDIQPIALPTGSAIRSERNNACLTLHTDNSVSVEYGNCQLASQQWFRDAAGRIHSALHPELCLQASSSGSRVSSCDSSAGFVWEQDASQRLQNPSSAGQCLDFASPNRAILYNCHGHENQRWQLPVKNEQAILAKLPGTVLKAL